MNYQKQKPPAFVYILIFIGIFLVFISGVFVPPGRAIRAVQDEGLTHVSVREQHGVGAFFFGCDTKDAAAFEVAATNVQGRQVNLTVCCGLLFKGCTIRH